MKVLSLQVVSYFTVKRLKDIFSFRNMYNHEICSFVTIGRFLLEEIELWNGLHCLSRVITNLMSLSNYKLTSAYFSLWWKAYRFPRKISNYVLRFIFSFKNGNSMKAGSNFVEVMFHHFVRRYGEVATRDLSQAYLNIVCPSFFLKKYSDDYPWKRKCL